MRTILKVLFHITLITWFILHFTCPQITHKYIGTVCSPITFEKELCVNSGSKTKYIFEYKDKVGNIRKSEDIRGWGSDREFITKSGTWVEKQLLEKGKVYIPGWSPGPLIEFIILCGVLGFFIAALLFSIICRITDYYGCRRCDCPMCVFRKETIEEDRAFFKHFNSFFGYK